MQEESEGRTVEKHGVRDKDELPVARVQRTARFLRGGASSEAQDWETYPGDPGVVHPGGSLVGHCYGHRVVC